MFLKILCIVNADIATHDSSAGRLAYQLVMEEEEEYRPMSCQLTLRFTNPVSQEIFL